MYSSEAATGSYVPNMSDSDKYSWKGKIIGSKTNSPRAELRKTYSRGGSYAQMLVVIYLQQDYVTISSNGKINMRLDQLEEFHEVTKEAIAKLKEVYNDRNGD
jgi:hypothetical protein